MAADPLGEASERSREDEGADHIGHRVIDPRAHSNPTYEPAGVRRSGPLPDREAQLELAAGRDLAHLECAFCDPSRDGRVPDEVPDVEPARGRASVEDEAILDDPSFSARIRNVAWWRTLVTHVCRHRGRP